MTTRRLAKMAAYTELFHGDSKGRRSHNPRLRGQIRFGAMKPRMKRKSRPTMAVSKVDVRWKAASFVVSSYRRGDPSRQDSNR